MSDYPGSNFDPKVEDDPEPLLPWTSYDDPSEDRSERLRELVEALMADAEAHKECAVTLVAAVIYIEHLRELRPDKQVDPAVVQQARHLTDVHGLRPN
jgi:hypothetical protein